MSKSRPFKFIHGVLADTCSVKKVPTLLMLISIPLFLRFVIPIIIIIMYV